MKLLRIFLLLLLAAGCGSTVNTKDPAIRNEARYVRPYDKVWADLIEYFAINDLPIEEINPDKGFITSVIDLKLEDFDKFTECNLSPEGASVEIPKVYFTVNATADTDGSTLVTSLAKFTAIFKDKGGGELKEMICPSNSKFEDSLYIFLDEKAAAIP